jgi:hypothetical protein
MRVKLLALALIVLVVVAGCGGGKKKTVAPATTAAAATTNSVTAETTATVKAPSFASTKNCSELVSLGAKLSAALQSSSGGTNSIEDEANVFKAMAAAAPDEIRGDFETFAGAFLAYAKALGKAGFKPGTTPTAAQVAALTAASKSFSGPKLLVAERHITAWARTNCGIGTTTTG